MNKSWNVGDIRHFARLILDESKTQQTLQTRASTKSPH